MVYSQNAGNGGTYEYLVCAGRQRKQCPTPWLRVEQIEGEVMPVVAAERLAPDAIDGMRASVTDAINNLLASDRDTKAQLTKQLRKLEAQEERLIELAATGTSAHRQDSRADREDNPSDGSRQREARSSRLIASSTARTRALAYIDLLGEPGNLYQRASDTVRRDLLTTYFSKLIVRVEDNKIQITGERNDANRGIREVRSRQDAASAEQTPRTTKPPPLKSREVGAKRTMASSFDHGSSNVR
ncbi:hypothetical protein JM654_15465, partial [Microbacterium oxydans]|nr:hypothetical protein [Microbacterium oxydans]